MSKHIGITGCQIVKRKPAPAQENRWWAEAQSRAFEQSGEFFRSAKKTCLQIVLASPVLAHFQGMYILSTSHQCS